MAGRQTHERLQGDGVKMGSERSFGIVFAVVFTIVACWPLVRGGEIRWWAAALAALWLAAGLLVPDSLRSLNRAWFKLGLLLSRIMTPVVMGLLFFLVVTPTALVMRLGAKNLLQLRRDPDARSYWIVRTPPGPTPDTMRNQF